MNTDILKLTKEDIFEGKAKGNFLYEENGEYYFTERKFNSMFVDNSNEEDEEKEAMNMDFDSYIEKLLDIYASSPKKPSIMFVNYWKVDFLKILNKDKRNFDITDFEWSETDKLKKFLDTPSVTCATGNIVSDVSSVFEMRTGIIPQNDIIIIFNEPERILNFPRLDMLTILSRSRNIFFIFNFKDKEKYINHYGKETYSGIADNCLTKFLYNSKGVFEIQPTNNTTFEK